MRLVSILSVLALFVMPFSGVRVTEAVPNGDDLKFSETGKTVRGLFAQYWRDNGGLVRQGYPISSELKEKSDVDGRPYLVQYFERAVFEYHPENLGKPSAVLLSLLGRLRYVERYAGKEPPQSPNSSSGSLQFQETGKRLGGAFLSYWQRSGGLPQLGYPISDEFQERSDLDGKTYTVQYFERAVMELHPENKAPYDVLLSQLGTYRLDPERASANDLPDKGGKALLEQARKVVPQKYQFAVDKGAQIALTDDGRSFYLYWGPGGAKSPSLVATRTIVTLHGSASWAFDEFEQWYSHAQKRGYAILALQWWFGSGDTTNSYYTPEAMHDVLRASLHEQAVHPDKAILHGFSRGAAQVYGLTFLDRRTADPYYHFTIANAGGAAPDYPIHQFIDRNAGPQSAFGGTKWIMFCGGKDPNAERDGCSAMRRTQEWVKSHGGAIVQLIEDPTGGHGSFHQNPANVERALELIESNW